MKLFINTAGLCIIPKLVNAAEAQLTKLMTPDTPPSVPLDRASTDELVQEIARREPRKQFITATVEVPSTYTPPYMEEVDTKREFDSLHDREETQEQTELELETSAPQKGSLNTSYGPGSTVKAHDQATNYTNSMPEPEEVKTHEVPRKGYTRCDMPITKEAHDKINEIWRWMQSENRRIGRDENDCYPHSRDDAAEITNNHFGADWGQSTITRCLRGPNAKTRIERDDCPSQADVDGDVIGSVSQFSDMDKLNIKTK